jgi:hypothetical protein
MYINWQFVVSFCYRSNHAKCQDQLKAARGRGSAAYVSDFMSKIFGMQILTLFYPRYQCWTARRWGAKFISAFDPQIVCKHPRQVGTFYPQNL